MASTGTRQAATSRKRDEGEIAPRKSASRGYTDDVGGWKWEMAVQSSRKMRSRGRGKEGDVMKLLIGDSGKKAAAVLAVAFFTLCLLTVVGCGSGTGKDNGKAVKSNSQPATFGNTWTNTNGGVSSYTVFSLACDSGHNLLYAGCYDPASHTGKGVWKYNGH